MTKGKILIVDDEPDLVEMVKARLEAGGYEVISACDGTEGLKKAIGQQPRLIILDIIMPHMDGYLVLERLKANSSTRRIPVVMLTARGDTQSIFKAQELKADDYLIKPFKSEELLSSVIRNISSEGGDAS